MSKRWLINYLLFILIIVFTWIGAKYPIREDQKINRATLTGLEAQGIREIGIESAEGNIELHKQGSRWMLSTPIDWYANNIASERLASLAAVQPDSTLPRQEVDLGEFGLLIPKAVVSLNGLRVLFGETNRIGNRRYLLAEPNIHLVEDIFFPFISQGLTAFVDTRLLPAALELTELKSNTFTITGGENGWLSNKPAHAKDAIDELVNNWQTKQANRVKPFESREIPLQKIIATLADDSTIEFFVLAIEPEIVIARPDLGLQYHFSDFNYYGLLEPAKPDA